MGNKVKDKEIRVIFRDRTFHLFLATDARQLRGLAYLALATASLPAPEGGDRS
jgi:hypothetical protein